jgi:hypothetical protein
MFQGEESPGSPWSPGTVTGLSHDDEGDDRSHQDIDILTDEDVDDVQHENESELNVYIYIFHCITTCGRERRTHVM